MGRYLWVEHRPARSEDALLCSALGVGEEREQEVKRRNGNESVRSYFIKFWQKAFFCGYVGMAVNDGWMEIETVLKGSYFEEG